MTRPKLHSPNFSFLQSHNEHLLEYAARAERYVLDDPNTTLIKLRQLAEELAELAAAYNNFSIDSEDGFNGILRRLKRKRIITAEMADIFHGLRKAGNAAAHEGAGDRQEAITQLKLAHRLAVWFHQAFRDPDFRPKPFALPPDPPRVSPELKEELDRLRKARWESERRMDETADALRKARREHDEAEQRAALLYSELEAALALVDESEAREAHLLAEHRARVATLHAEAGAITSAEMDALQQQAREAAERFDLTEGEARERIDAALRAQGWEADSVVRTWEKGARPGAGRNQAIAFCPAGDGHADYVLYCGEGVGGIIEAKRRNLDLQQGLKEAEVHSRTYGSDRGEPVVPLLFASNGRPFANPTDTMHGIWHRDLRLGSSDAVVLEKWPTPEELKAMLEPTRLEA